MALGRRKVRLEDQASWVFNRMAEVYSARPDYPPALVDALVALLPKGAVRVLDVGAGIGHLALPLAVRGLDVVAVEPAQAMLDVLRTRAPQVQALHATAEALPLSDASFDLAVVSDALHFLDAELSGRELARVLKPGAGLGLISVSLGETPFMRSVVKVMEDSAPRRPRDTQNTTRQFFKMAHAVEEQHLLFEDHTEVEAETLERILRSISFIGPAMNQERFAVFAQRIVALEGPRIWTRRFNLKAGHRK